MSSNRTIEKIISFLGILLLILGIVSWFGTIVFLSNEFEAIDEIGTYQDLYAFGTAFSGIPGWFIGLGAAIKTLNISPSNPITKAIKQNQQQTNKKKKKEYLFTEDSYLSALILNFLTLIVFLVTWLPMNYATEMKLDINLPYWVLTTPTILLTVIVLLIILGIIKSKEFEMSFWNFLGTKRKITGTDRLSAKYSGIIYYNEWIKLREKGFKKKIEQEQAERLGLETRSQLDHWRSLGFRNLEEQKQANELGFKTKAEYDFVIISDLSTKDELTEYINDKIDNFEEEIKLLEKGIRKIKSNLSKVVQKEKISEYNRTMKRTFEKTSKIHIEIDKIKKAKVTIGKTQLIKIAKSLDKLTEDMDDLRPALKERRTYLINKGKILEALENIPLNTQVSFKRFTELTKLTPALTKSYLNAVLQSNPELGEYLESEELFIRHGAPVPKEELRQLQPVQKVIKKELICLYCEAQLEEIDDDGPIVCLNCGKKAPYCEICKNIIVAREKVVQSMNCNHIFHKNHIIEWIKVRGFCPVCKEKINEEALKPFMF